MVQKVAMMMGGLGVFIEPGVRKTQDSVEDRTCLDTQHVPGSGGGVYWAFPTGQGDRQAEGYRKDNGLNED